MIAEVLCVLYYLISYFNDILAQSIFPFKHNASAAGLRDVLLEFDPHSVGWVIENPVAHCSLRRPDFSYEFHFRRVSQTNGQELPEREKRNTSWGNVGMSKDEVSLFQEKNRTLTNFLQSRVFQSGCLKLFSLFLFYVVWTGNIKHFSL